MMTERFEVRLTKDLHQKLAEYAQAQGTTQAQVVRKLIAGLDQEKKFVNVGKRGEK